MADDEGAAAVAEKPKRSRGKAAATPVQNNGESGDNAPAEAGDKLVEFARQTYTLDDMQRDALAHSKLDDRQAGTGDKTSQDAFWRAAGDRLGFNPVTVEESEDIGQSGVFTAFPADNIVPQGTAALPDQHTSAIDRMEQMTDELVLDDRTLVFDIRDFLLGQIKARPKPWSATSQGEQRDVAAACEHAATELTRMVVEAIAARQRKAVRVLLTKIAIGDDVVITGKVKPADPADEEEAVAILHHARGKHVMLTVASVDDFRDGQREAETEPDQPGLGFEAGTDEHPADDRDLAEADEDARRINTGTGLVEEREDGTGDWIETGPASLEELGEEGVGDWRVNLKTGMVERLPNGHAADDDTAWVDVREATPEELAAERERLADFDPE